MSTKPLPSAELADSPTSTNTGPELALQRRFYQRNGAWFVKHSEQDTIGPFADKADAQMAMLYYSARLFWPSEKQLREFARSGK